MLDRLLIASILGCPVLAAAQPGELNGLIEQGREIFMHPFGCQDCHGIDALGDFGPSLDFGPTPYEIDYELRATAEMQDMQSVLRLSREDILAVSVFIRQHTGVAPEDIDLAALRSSLDQIEDLQEAATEFTRRERVVKEIEQFSSVLDEWERRARTGSLRRDLDIQVIAEFDAGEPAFEPQPNTMYFYENTGTGGTLRLDNNEFVNARTTQVVVGNAATREIVAHAELPAELRSSVHTSAVSPDGRWVYIVGAGTDSTAAGRGGMGGMGPPGGTVNSILAPATLLKVDALTLRPVRQLDIKGRIHHAQVFQDRYLLIDTFISEPDGLRFFLLDTDTDKAVGGISSRDLGGEVYTVWTDQRYIYALMQSRANVARAVARFHRGELTTMMPAWIAKIDPDTWEVVAEFPHPGYRANWICFDGPAEFMYVPSSGNSSVSKLNTTTGEILWTTATGPGPYGCAVNADNTEVWVADKGEGSGFNGRTITVINAVNGRLVETLFSAYAVDHILLDPTGTQFWLTSNREGSIYVFDAATRRQIDVIEMPDAGDPHGLVWVHYDSDGNAHVVADQGGFHSGIDPRNGRPL